MVKMIALLIALLMLPHQDILIKGDIMRHDIMLNGQKIDSFHIKTVVETFHDSPKITIQSQWNSSTASFEKLPHDLKVIFPIKNEGETYYIITAPPVPPKGKSYGEMVFTPKWNKVLKVKKEGAYEKFKGENRVKEILMEVTKIEHFILMSDGKRY